jgi:hypothetical protein
MEEQNNNLELEKGQFFLIRFFKRVFNQEKALIFSPLKRHEENLNQEAVSN